MNTTELLSTLQYFEIVQTQSLVRLRYHFSKIGIRFVHFGTDLKNRQEIWQIYQTLEGFYLKDCDWRYASKWQLTAPLNIAEVVPNSNVTEKLFEKEIHFKKCHTFVACVLNKSVFLEM